MNFVNNGRRMVVGLLAVVFIAVVAGSVRAESGAEKFYRAFYLENNAGDWTAACKLYEEAAGDPSLAAPIKAQAQVALAACKEELASRDFAALMPAETMLYLELKRPGDQLMKLLDQLGLLANEQGGPKDAAAAKAGRYLAVSPKIIRELLGMRGAAAAITGFNPMKQAPTGVLVFHAGDMDVLRGIIETGLPAGGAPADAIGGFATYKIEDDALITLTNRLVIVSPDKAGIEGVIKRLRGEETKSLAANPRMAETLKNRDDSLLFFAVDAKTVMPFVTGMMAMAGGVKKEFAVAQAVLDPNSLQSVVGRLGVNDAGAFLNFTLRLDKSHHNLVYNFFRTASINRETLKSVPEGAAVVWAGALSDGTSRFTPGARGGESPQVVTALDLGREIFANITTFALFVVPPDDSVSAEPKKGPPIPDGGLIITVNDPAKSDAIWRQFLGLAGLFGGAQTMEGATVKIENQDVRTYPMKDGPTIYFATVGNDVLISCSSTATGKVLQARKSGKSFLSDPTFAPAVAKLGSESTGALFVHPARGIAVAKKMAPPDDVAELAEVEPYLPLLANTVLSWVTDYGPDTLNISGTLTGLPKIGPVVADLMQQEQAGGAKHARADQTKKSPKPEAAVPAIAVTKPEKVSTDRESLQKKFESLVIDKNDPSAAAACAEQLLKLLSDDAKALNNFAWDLLTNKKYGGKFKEIALNASERCNELTGEKQWAYLDTLALARFENGDKDAALRIQKRAIELSGGEAAGELKERLARFEAAMKK